MQRDAMLSSDDHGSSVERTATLLALWQCGTVAHELAACGLEVKLAPSAWCPLGAAPQGESGPLSNRLHRGRLRDNDRIAKGIATSRHPATCPAVMSSRSKGIEPLASSVRASWG